MGHRRGDSRARGEAPQRCPVKYRRALLLVELAADPAPALSALAHLSEELECLELVIHGEPDTPQSVSVWHEAAAKVSPRVEVHQTRELSSDALVEITRGCGADLLVAGAPSLGSARLLAGAAKRLDVAILWPSEEPLERRIEHAFCIAVGERTRAAVLRFLQEHAGPGLTVSVAGPPASTSVDLSAALRASGVRSPVELIPRRQSVRAALDAARGGERVDLFVLAKLPALLLVGYSWPAPVLLVPTHGLAVRHRLLDVPDVVEMDGRLLSRIEEVVVGDVLSVASERRLAFAVGDGVALSCVTTADGEVELPESFSGATDVVAWVAEEGPPDVLAAADQRFRVIRPSDGRFTLFDAELDAGRLPEVATPGALSLAVRLRPTRRVRSIRRRLLEAGLETPVVDARAVLDEGVALDVVEANDAVRLRRVAARMKKAGYRVSVFEALPVPLGIVPREELIGGNRVELEFDNALARRWLLEGIQQAQQSVSLQVYMAADDDVGQLVEAALVAAGKRGVAVRLLVDSLHGLHGSFGVENPLLTRLSTQQGVELRVSRPVSVPSMEELKRRDHRKLVVLDGRTAIVGGRNLSHEYYTGFDEVALRPTSTWRALPWLDAGARLDGPAVRDIEDSFIAAWIKAGGSGFAPQPLEARGSVPLRVVVHHGLEDAHTLETYLELIAGARSHVYVVHGFPLLLELQHALLRALSRGIRVSVLGGHPMPSYDGQAFPGPWGTARNTATEVAHSRLDPIVRAGGEVHLYAKRGVQGWDPSLGVVSPHVHSKVLSVDGERCVVGSANFDVTSSYWESELMIVVEHRGTTSAFERRIEELIAEASRVDPEDPEWQARAAARSWMRRWPGMLSP